MEKNLRIPSKDHLVNGIYIIPIGIEVLGDGLFSGLPGDEIDYFDAHGIIIPESVKHIGEYAFYDCFGNINEIKLPSTIESIGESAFFALDGLKKIYVNSHLKSVGKYAFVNLDKDCELVFAKKEFYTPNLWHPEWNPHTKVVISE